MHSIEMRLILLLSVFILKIMAKETSKFKVDEDLMKQSVFYGLVATAAQEPSTSTCQIELAKTADGILKRKRWAIKMLDASGTPSGQLYIGGTYWLGSRYVCELVENIKELLISNKSGMVYKETAEDVPPFSLAYYAAYFQHHSNVQTTTNLINERRITWGICLPKSCEGTELSEYLQKYFDSNMMAQQFIYNTTYEVEEVKKLIDDYSWMNDIKFLVTVSIIFASVILCIVGTIFDIFFYQPVLKNISANNVASEDENVGINDNKKKDNLKTDNTSQQIDEILDLSLGSKLILCFSVCRNNNAIFDKKIDSKSLSSVHGLKSLTMLWSLSGHSLLFMQDYFDNQLKQVFLSADIHTQFFVQSFFGVDSFFCISGLLLSYSFFTSDIKISMKIFKLSRAISFFFSAIFKRFLRLIPFYTFTILVVNIVANWRFREMPFWSDERNDLTCPKFWWRNILFINIFFPQNEMCVAWSWYISNDIQFFILTMLLLIFSCKHFKTAVILFKIIFFGSIAYTVNLVFRTDFIPLLNEMYYNREYFYYNPILRIGPYLVGVAAGYVLYCFKRRLPIKRPFIWIFWILDIGIFLFLIFGTANRNYSVAGSAAYMSLTRSFWAIAIAWVIIACETGNGGIVNKILSSHLWLPLSRLSLVTYLINPLIIFVIMSFTDTPYKAEMSNSIILMIAFIVLTYFASYVLTLMIESPNIALTKILFDQLAKIEKKNKSNMSRLNHRKLISNEKKD